MKKFNQISVVVVSAIAFVFGLTGLNTAHAVTPPNRGLGLADSYSVFGKAGVTTTGVTHVWGDAGADSSMGLIPSQVGGSIYTGSGVAGVETDARSTYDSLMSATQGTPAGVVTGLNLAGTHTTGNGNPITPGVYTVGATTMNGAVELSGAGVYIFRSDSSATIAASGTAVMTLTNGACASNVFWAIPASMTIGTGAHIEGTIIAHSGLISLATGATLVGRAISLISQVTLDANQITQPTCAASANASTDTSTDTSTDIKVKKTASDYKLNSGPKKVTFTYKVTNEGDVALTDVSVKDDECDDVNYVSGDDNNNDELDTNEEWKYTCKKTVKKTETNIVTAKGHANGEEVKDTDTAKVTVSTPELPSAGIGPEDKNNIPWNIIIPTEIFIALFSFYLARKKLTI